MQNQYVRLKLAGTRIKTCYQHQFSKLSALTYSMFFVLALTFVQIDANAETRVFPLKTNPDNRTWLYYSNGKPHFTAGPGDPENFLYRGELLPDGTREGDQEEIVAKLANSGANSIYIQAIRSHGGDGDKTHNPFVNNDPKQGINFKVLDQWNEWIAKLEKAGVAVYFFFYDDSARVWGEKPKQKRKWTLNRIAKLFTDRGRDALLPVEEQRFIETIVRYLNRNNNIVWVIAEEFEEAFTADEIIEFASYIRAADVKNFPIAIHRSNGLNFSEFADAPNIDQFAIQYNDDLSLTGLNKAMMSAWKDAKGRYNINMSEIAFGQAGSGDKLRQRAWVMALGGAYVMINGMDVASTPDQDLKSMGILSKFMESIEFSNMAPSTEITVNDSQFVMADPIGKYLLYSSGDNDGTMGLRNMTPGAYDMVWLDVVTGQKISAKLQTVESSGVNSWAIPKDIGKEVALYLRKTSIGK